MQMLLYFRQLAKMHSIILRKQYDQEKAKLEFAKEIDSLKDKLSILELEVKEKDHQNDQMEKVIFHDYNFFMTIIVENNENIFSI